jgi:uncharacterized protein involved in exopolysaccharide biosynthesis
MVDRVDGLVRYATPALPPDQPVETGRYLDALRRSKLLIALIVLPLAAVVLVVSLLLPKTYQATAKIVLESASDPLQTRDVNSTERRLATIDALLTTRETRRRAARRIPGETATTLDGKVASSVNPTADIISIVATTPRRGRRGLPTPSPRRSSRSSTAASSDGWTAPGRRSGAPSGSWRERPACRSRQSAPRSASG